MRSLIAGLLLLFVAPAVADSCHLSSVRIDRNLLMVGDGERAVLERSPDRRVLLENRFGAVVAVRYEFHLDAKTVEITVRQGRITRICHVRG